MTSFNIVIGALVEMNGEPYRVLDISPDDLLLISTIKDRLSFERINRDVAGEMLCSGKLIVKEEEKAPEIIGELSEGEQELVRLKKELIEELLRTCYPNLEVLQSRQSSTDLTKFLHVLDVSKSTAFRLIRLYLQSGRNFNSLVDKRKLRFTRTDSPKRQSVRGRKDMFGNSSNVLNDEVLNSRFEKYYDEFLKTKERGGSLRASYEHMIAEFYSSMNRGSDTELVAGVNGKADRPSYKRFWRYAVKRAGRKLNQIKKSDKEQRNNDRLLLGNARIGCEYPGQILEIDELEIDMISVSADDSRQIVGRAVLYLAVDVYSGCIVAYWADFRNNSIHGITNLLFTLTEDHDAQLKRIGRSADSSVFPSRFLPEEIRVDHGAEYVSNEFRRVARELGITVTFCEPGMGSQKGLVEQRFHQFQELLRSEARNAGVILKQINSRHYETACTDIYDIRVMAADFVLDANRNNYTARELDRDMIENNVIAVPVMIWKYGMEMKNKPRQITETNVNSVRYALCLSNRSFRLTRAGVIYDKLYYYSPHPWLIQKMQELEKKSVRLSGVRYDPRSINAVYIKEAGLVYRIDLNVNRAELKSYLDLTWEEYDKLVQKRRELNAQYEDTRLANRLNTRKSIRETVENAKLTQEKGINNKKSITQARSKERNHLAYRDRLDYLAGDHFEKNNLDAFSETRVEQRIPFEASSAPEEEKAYISDDREMGDYFDM